MEDIFPSTISPDFNIISLVMLYCLMDVRVIKVSGRFYLCRFSHDIVDYGL